MKKILTAIGNSWINKKCQEYEEYNILKEDIENDEELIQILEIEKDIDILFLCSNIIKNYSVEEFIRIIKKLQENVYIIFFKKDNLEINIEEYDNIEIYSTMEIDVEVFEKFLRKEQVKQITKKKSNLIAISGVSGVRQKYLCSFFFKKY